MKYSIIILCHLFSTQLYALEERLIGKEILRITTEKNGVHKITLKHLKKPLTMEVAGPLFVLSEYAECSTRGLAPERNTTHFEPNYIESFFVCNDKVQPLDFRHKKVDKHCENGGYLSFAQRVLCRELGLAE